VSEIRREQYKTALGLLLLTAGALLVHGYHPFAEDAEIYLPGVQKILHPELFPTGQEFFASHASLTLFPNLIAFSLRVTHLPMEVGLFLWYLISIFLLLLACWELSGKCFANAKARWAGTALVAALLTIPVSGTALYIMDQYLNPRNLAAFAAVFAVARVLDKKYARAAIWLAFAASVHPLMALFAVSYCALLTVMEKMGRIEGNPAAAVLALLPLGFSLGPSSAAYHEAVFYHGYFNTLRWQWYEWLGVVGPAALLWWFRKTAQAQRWRVIDELCRALTIYALIYLVVMLVVCTPVRFENLERLQPLRSLHLLYIVMFVLGGGLLAEFVLRDRAWRWLVVFVPLSAGMFVAQRALFPDSAHIEWPAAAPRNEWAQAFKWVSAHTPVDALFALDPRFIQLPGEDAVGFRCLAQRSRLADLSKDSGAVSMFPPLADEWWLQVQSLNGWRNFQKQDFQRLKKQFGVSWVVLQQPGSGAMVCPYTNNAVRVCQIP
jgi:hypothetical protein